ncbi:hypothetical protein ACJJTC_009848, partial [Scirpophaga incertulas]
MHGRVKVRSSEEEKLRKEQERREKLKVFKHAMQKVQAKRSIGELDEELLELTGNVLSSNPDIYTLWNIRREVLISFENDKALQEKMTRLYDSELRLTEYCLKINPKSYGSWHQREWVLTTRQDPDWETEISVCNKYLKLDERNFHTWDYRRFVVSQCKPPLQEEFEFTTEKLLENFSNYSAWHYRSKMLVELYPDNMGGRPIADDYHKKELKMVQSAAFTDPDDTSAWFYQRWLLGAVKNDLNLVVGTVTAQKVFVAFNQFVSKDIVNTKTKLDINNKIIFGDWLSCTGNEFDTLWILNHNETMAADMDIKIQFMTGNDMQIIPCLPYEDWLYIGKNNISFQNKYSEPVLQELKEQLDSCRQLLALEPSSKWTLLTTTVFLNCIDAQLYHNEVIENLKLLQDIDKLRSGYYEHLKTRWCIENQLYEDYKNKELTYKILFKEKVSSLPHLQFYSYCVTVDLSNQNLTSKILPSLVMLQNCKSLSLKNNKIHTLKGFPPLTLEEVDLRDNDLNKDDADVFVKTVGYR